MKKTKGSEAKPIEFDRPVFGKTVLANGVRVVTERHRHTRVISAGLFVDLGSRDEPTGLEGAAHFLEHLVFKKTRRRTGLEIARSLEAVGGDLNAYTTHEHTCFHASALNEDLGLAIDVLADLVSGALLEERDFLKERQVILHELDSVGDDLEEYTFELFLENYFSGAPLGRPILGSQKSLQQMKLSALRDFYRRRYGGKHLVLSVAGNVDHAEVVAMAARLLEWRPQGPVRGRRRAPRPRFFRRYQQRQTEQNHVLVGLPSVPFRSPLRFAAYVVNAVLGGGMTSRLYQKIREERGLAYAISSGLQSWTDAGLMLIYAATSHQHLLPLLKQLDKELLRLVRNGVARKDLDFFKKQVKGSILLGSDDMENRMNSLAVNEMVFGEYRPVDRVIDEITGVTRDSVQELLETCFSPDQRGVLLLGSAPEEVGEKWVREWGA